MNKVLLNSGVGLLFLATTCGAAAASIFLFKKEEGVGCAVVQRIRPVNQQPIFDDSTFPKWKANNGHLLNSGGQLFQLLQIIPGVGALAAGATELAVDAAVNSEKSEKLAVKLKSGEVDLKVAPDANGNYRDVEAVTFKMQNGLLVNLPLQRGMMPIKIGSAALLSYSKITNSLQRDPYRRVNGVQEYLNSEECALTKSIYTPEQAEEILRANANLVDESKIIAQ